KAILRSSRSYQDKTFRIETKKTVVVQGVPHEIDIWVEIESAPGYKTTFIFECKNWKKRVGKNEIIIFSEKVDATQAAKGFFVAKSFAKTASAQAVKCPRVELLKVDEELGSHLESPFPLTFSFNESGNVTSFEFRRWDRTVRPQPNVVEIDKAE